MRLMLNTRPVWIANSGKTSAKGSGTNATVAAAAPAGTMIINPQKPSCESCHNTTQAQYGLTVSNSHHVYGGGSAEYTRFSGYGYPSTVAFNGTFSANLSDGLQCNDCHVFNTTAHNWN